MPSVIKDNSPVHTNSTAPGQIGLLRDSNLHNFEGLYTCIIPDENNTNITLRVALYKDGSFTASSKLINTIVIIIMLFVAGPSIDGAIVFTINSTRDRDPPSFTLSFNVTELPPTNVTCTVNGVDLNITHNDIQRSVLDTMLTIEVTISLSLRVPGVYQCIVSNARVSMGMGASPATANLTLSGKCLL